MYYNSLLQPRTIQTWLVHICLYFQLEVFVQYLFMFYLYEYKGAKLGHAPTISRPSLVSTIPERNGSN